MGAVGWAAMPAGALMGGMFSGGTLVAGSAYAKLNKADLLGKRIKDHIGSIRLYFNVDWVKSGSRND